MLDAPNPFLAGLLRKNQDRVKLIANKYKASISFDKYKYTIECTETT